MGNKIKQSSKWIEKSISHIPGHSGPAHPSVSFSWERWGHTWNSRMGKGRKPSSFDVRESLGNKSKVSGTQAERFCRYFYILAEFAGIKNLQILYLQDRQSAHKEFALHLLPGEHNLATPKKGARKWVGHEKICRNGILYSNCPEETAPWQYVLHSEFSAMLGK